MPHEFSKEQLDFLAKYLKPIEAKIKAKGTIFGRSKREEHNADVRREMEEMRGKYADWLAARDEVAGILDRVEISYDLSKIPEQKTKYDDLRKWHGEIVGRVRKAPEDAPIFTTGISEMGIVRREALGLDRRAKEAIENLPPPPKTGLFDNVIVDIDAMAAFANHPSLTEKAVKTALTDPTAEQSRKDAAAAHDNLCHTAKRFVVNLRQQVLGGGDQADLEKQALSTVVALRSDRVPHLKTLAEAISSGALSRMQTLSEGGDTVAAREVDRMEKMRTDAGKIGTAVTAINDKLAGLRSDLEEAEGFQEKRAILAEINAEKDRQAAMELRAQQMAAYEAATALRLEKMEAAENSRDAVDTLVSAIDPDSEDFEDQLAAWVDQRKEERAAAKPEDAEFPEVAPNERAYILAQIDRNEVFFAASAARVLVDAKMYPNEADVTEISASQHATLQKMLDTARVLYGKDKFDEAQEMYISARQLHMTFIGSRNFTLPAIPADAQPMSQQVEGELKSAAVQIDRVYGRGTDVTDFERRLDQLRRDADAAGSTEPQDFRAVLTDIGTLKRDLELALRTPPVTLPADDTAKQKAGEVADKINRDLLSLYRTEPIRESDIAGVHPNDLLVVIGDGGTKEYHRIKLRDDETVQRREDKRVPREAIDALRQKMQMLEVMKDIEGAGVGDAVDGAATDAENWRDAVMKGAPFYERVTKALVAFDKALADKKLKEWRMNGIADLQSQKDSFEKSYAANMLPKDAAERAEELLAAAKAKVDGTEDLKTRYNTASDKLDVIENRLAAKPKGDDPTLGRVLADLIKNGVQSFSTGPLNPAQMAEALRLQEQIAADLQKIKDLGQHGTGVQGALRKELGKHRTTLDTKSEQAITDIEQRIPTLEQSVHDKLAAVSVRPVDDPMKYLRQIAEFTGGVKQACVDQDAAKTEAETKKAAAKEAVAEVKITLNGVENLASKNEFKSIVESLQSQYDNASKAWNKGKGDAGTAISAFTPIISNAAELKTDLENLNTVHVGGESVDINGWGKAITDNLGKVARGAEAAGTLIETLYKQDDPPEDEAEKQALETAIGKVQATMGLVGNLNGQVAFSTGLQAIVDRAVAETDPAEKRKLLGSTRETVLTELRRINGHLDGDPAIGAYRDNPFDHGEHWPQLKATLLSCETEVLKSLNPGR